MNVQLATPNSRPSRLRRLRAAQGMTLVEASIILAVVSALAAMLAPGINGYMDTARAARAREDVETIADAIRQFVSDTGELQFLKNRTGTTSDGQPPSRDDTNRVNLLVSDGDIPALATAISTETFWTLAINTGDVDTLSNHLVENLPTESAAKRYRNPTDILVGTPGGNNIDFARAESSGFNAPHAWRGPYLRGPIDSDPWGNRYAANVAFLDPSPTSAISNITSGFASPANDYPRLDVFVVSAGPDEEIETPSAQDGVVPADDDIIALVSGNAK